MDYINEIMNLPELPIGYELSLEYKLFTLTIILLTFIYGYWAYKNYKDNGKTIFKAKNKKIIEENKNKKVISWYVFNGEYMNLNEVLNILTTAKNRNPNNELIVRFKINKDNNCEIKIKG